MEPRRLAQWPSIIQLETMGFQPCKSQPCSTWVDPQNVPSGFCLTHWRKHRQAQRKQQQQRTT